MTGNGFYQQYLWWWLGDGADGIVLATSRMKPTDLSLPFRPTALLQRTRRARAGFKWLEKDFNGASTAAWQQRAVHEMLLQMQNVYILVCSYGGSVHVKVTFTCIYLSIYLPTYRSMIYISIDLSIYLAIYASMYLCIYASRITPELIMNPVLHPVRTGLVRTKIRSLWMLATRVPHFSGGMESGNSGKLPVTTGPWLETIKANLEPWLVPPKGTREAIWKAVSTASQGEIQIDQHSGNPGDKFIASSPSVIGHLKEHQGKLSHFTKLKGSG